MINPFLNYFICIFSQKVFKIIEFTTCQWPRTFDGFNFYLNNLAIDYIKLCLTFKTIVFSMNMNRLMLIGVKKYQNPQIFKNLWHQLFFTNLIIL